MGRLSPNWLPYGESVSHPHTIWDWCEGGANKGLPNTRRLAGKVEGLDKKISKAFSSQRRGLGNAF